MAPEDEMLYNSVQKIKELEATIKAKDQEIKAARAKKNHVKPSTTSSPIAKNDGDDYAVPLSALEDTPRSTDLHGRFVR